MSIKSLEEMSEFLHDIKFHRKWINGVDEEDVWQVLGLLQKEYRQLFEADEYHHQKLIQERNVLIRRQQKEIIKLKKAIQAMSGTNDEKR